MGIGAIAFVAIIIVAFIIVFILKNRGGEDTEEDTREDGLYNPDIKGHFFSSVEKEFYINLNKVITNNYGDKYVIFPKVRLADIFNTQHLKKGVRRLCMSHVDFLIVDKTQDFKPMLAIELDGNSHKEYRQYKADQFKNKIFNNSNLPLRRFDNSTAGNSEVIRMNINQYLGTPVKN